MNAARKVTTADIYGADNPKAMFVVLLSRGFWPVAIHPGGKNPIGLAWGKDRWTLEKANEAFQQYRGAGVGICLGPGRGPGGSWLIDVEGDGPEAEQSRATLFGGELVETLGWDSVRGGHRLLAIDGPRLEEILPRLKGMEQKGPVPGVYKFDSLPSLELRLGGYTAKGTIKQAQSVVPPTPGTDGKPRRWTGPVEVSEAPEAFYRNLEQLAPPPPEKKKRPPRPDEAARDRFAGPPVDDEDRLARALAKYCLVALANEAAKVATTQEGRGEAGGRHNALRAATMNMAGLVATGHLAAHQYREALGHAASECGLPDADANDLIESALGEATPRDMTDIIDRIREGWAAKGSQEQRKATGTDGMAGAGPEPKTHGFNVVGGDDEDATPPEPPEAKRPEIEITTQRHTVLEQTLEALAADPDTYRRGPFLVRVVRESQEVSRLTTRSVMKNVAGLPKIIPLADPVIGTRLTKFADFYQWKKVGKDEERAVSAHPPDWLVKAVGALGHWPTIRRLMSVVECPFPRPDGSIVEGPGYDAETSTLFMPAESFPRVPDSPTRDDARAAWDRLKHHVRQFPFQSEDDRVVYLAGMLNVIGRVAVEGPVMGVAVIGNKASTGKGLLVDAMTIPGIGRTAPTTNYPSEKEEANKVKVAIVLSGKPVVSFDNLEEGSMYGGSVIDSALTAHSIDERILGASKNTGDLEVRTTWFLNGNNLNPTKDAYRRWMVCNLVTEHERPEQRDDIEDKDLRKVITRHRGEIVRDALTILRAHAVAGWPNGGWAPAGSFEDWDRVVRGAVWFATDRDCLATQRKTADEAPDRLAKIALLQGWYEMDGGRAGQCGMTVVEALKELDRIPAGLETLRAALMQKSRGGKLPDPRIVGNMLRGLRNNLIGGYRLVEAGKKQGSVCWVVEHKENDRQRNGESGESGESDSNPRTRDSSSDTYSFKFSEDPDAYQEWQERDSRDSRDSRADSAELIADDGDWGDA